MAETTKDTIFKVKIEGVEREIKSLKDLKQAKKDATDAFLKGDKDAAKTLVDLKDKTDDLADATITLKKDGVEPLTGSFSLFKEGFGSGDLDKISVGFKGLKAAMSAIPIFLLIEGFKLLIENFEEIINFFGKAKTQSELLTDALNDQKKANEGLSSSISNQIKLLEAQGGSEQEILKLKKQLIDIKIKEAEADLAIQKQKIQEILLNNTITETLYKQAAAFYRSQGNAIAANEIDKKIAKEKAERIKEAEDKIREDIITIQNLKTEDQINEIKDNKEREKKQKEHLAELSKNRKEQFEKDKQQSIIDANDLFNQLSQQQDAELALRNKKREEEKNARKAELTQRFLDEMFIENFIKEQAEKEITIAKYVSDAKKSYQESAFIAAQGVVTLLKILGAENKNLQKAALLAENAAAIAKMIINNASSNVAVRAQGAALAIPTGGASVATAEALALKGNITTAIGVASVAAATAKALGLLGGGGSGGGVNISSTSSGGNVSVNTAPTTLPQGLQPSTTFDNNGQNTNVIKAEVVETDVTNSQDRVRRLTRQSQFG